MWVQIRRGHTKAFPICNGHGGGPKVPLLQGRGGGGIAVSLCVGIRDERKVTVVAIVPACADELGLG